MAEQTPKPPWRHARDLRPRKMPPPVVVRFTADSGEVWTVWDTTFSKFKHHRYVHCDEAARARVFVNAAGVKRSYTFKRNESRMLDPVQLEQQLRAASYVGEMPDLSGRTPR
jgi:hypothetical protein